MNPQPFGEPSELEGLEQRFAALGKTRRILLVLMSMVVLFLVVWMNLFDTIIGPLPKNQPRPPEQKQALIWYGAVAIAGFVGVMSLAIPALVLNFRIKRLREDLEHRRMFPRN